MTYARIADNVVVEYPVFEGDIRTRYPNVSFSIPFVPPEGFVAVSVAQFPKVDYTKTVLPATPTLVDSGWVQDWEIVDSSPEVVAERTENQARTVRADRDSRLFASDWTQFNDSPLDPDEKLAWALYRETLRMVPQQPGFPWEINWPPKPGA
jgi:hypothetical protein